MNKIFQEIKDNLYKDDPISMLKHLVMIAIAGSSLSDEDYYTILLNRNKLTLKHIQTDYCYNMIISPFKEGKGYNFIKLLEEVELLNLIFPSINKLIGVDGGHYHNETVYTHVTGALRALDKLKLPWYVKLAALYHDCGKQKWEISPEGKRRFTNHAPFGAQLVEGDLRRLKFPEGIISTVKTLVCYHMSHMNDQMQIHVHSLRKVKAKFDELNIPFKYFFWIRYADNKGSAVKQTDFMYYWKVYRRSLKALNPPHVPSVKDLEMNGYDIMRNFGDHNGGGIEGRCIGFILKSLFNEWQEGKIENEYAVLLTRAKELHYEFTKVHGIPVDTVK